MTESNRVEIRPITTEQLLRVDDMFTDEYQAGYKNHIVNRIVKDWDQRKFTKPTVSKIDDGMYAIVDGKHRVAAAKKVFEGKDLHILCDVFEGEGLKRDAEIYESLNSDRRNYGIDERFHKDIASGVESAIWLNNLAKDNGFVILSDNGLQSGSWNRLPISPIFLVYRDTKGQSPKNLTPHAKRTLELAIRSMGKAWIQGDGGNWRHVGGRIIEATVVSGVIQVARAGSKMETNGGDFDEARLTNVLRGFLPQTLLQSGKIVAGKDNIDISTGVATTIQKAYNSRLSGPKRVKL